MALVVGAFSVIVKSWRIFVSTSRACPQVMSDLLSAWVLSSSSPDPGTGLSSALDQARLGYHAQVTNHSGAASHVTTILISDWLSRPGGQENLRYRRHSRQGEQRQGEEDRLTRPPI